MQAGFLPNLLAVLLLFTVTPAEGAEPTNCGIFLLKRDRAQIVLERVPVPSAETKVIVADPASGVIGAVFPPGPGGSASLEQPREGRMIVLRCTEDRLRCEVREEGRTTSGYPERRAADLALYDTRVSVVCGDGTRAVFLITGYAEAVADSGPVQNLFAGAPIQLGAGDYMVTTDTYRRTTGESIEGSTPVDVTGHAFVHVTGPGGHTGWFILDTGAAESVVSKAFLVDTARITKAEMIEYSSAGRRTLGYAPSGATGPVLGVLGHVRLAELRAGTLRFRDVVAAVLPEIPDFFDRPVAGVIGLDLLRRAESLTIEYPPGTRGTGRIRLGPASAPRAGDARVPFSLVSSHAVIAARINGIEAFMILDSGAPGALLDSAAAVAAGIPFAADRTAKGIDGRGAASASAVMASLQVGERRLSGVPCQVSALHALRTLREDRPVGLFGNDLIARFERLVIDFSRRSIFLAGLRKRP